METRKITVVDSSTQKHSVIMSGAETLGELKRDFEAAGINCEGKTFFEGHARAEYLDDASLLPRDIMYKGAVTNDLVFMITDSNKKIKSGASRAEVYTEIKSRGLENRVKELFGRNYTQVPTKDLESILNAGTDVNTTDTKAETTEKSNNPIEVIVDCFIKVTDCLAEADIMDCDEVNELQRKLKEIKGKSVNSVNTKEVLESPYTDDEIDEMFNFNL